MAGVGGRGSITLLQRGSHTAGDGTAASGSICDTSREAPIANSLEFAVPGNGKPYFHFNAGVRRGLDDRCDTAMRRQVDGNCGASAGRVRRLEGSWLDGARKAN